jgi:hypothetical protein
MKYLCLICYEEKQLDALSRNELDALVKEMVAHSDELRQRGRLLAAHALEGVQTATTVRHRNGRISTTDGPFAETKEQIGGFLLIDAADLNEAIALAGRIPLARLGSIEVRPLSERCAREVRGA